jgi:transposase-like protein
MYKPTCPFCHGRKIVKYGHPRWKCKNPRCRKTFRLKRKDHRDRSAIAGYVLDRSTYRRLGIRWHVSPATAYRRVQSALSTRYTLLQRTKRSLHLCDGIVILDGKQIRIQGKLHTLFVAWDRELGLPIHFILAEGGEKELWYWKMITELKYIGYIPKGFVSDGIATLKEYLSDAYSNLPHQRCTVHVFLSARGKLGAGKTSDERLGELIELLRLILWSKNLRQSRARFLKLWQTIHLTKNERRVLEFIWSALPECFVCCDQKWKYLHLPRSSNAIENVMGQIEARLKTQRGNKNLDSSKRLINEILLQVTRQVINQK